MKGSVKDIARLALPVIFGSIAQTSISVADTAMLGRVGTVELAALGIVSVFYLTLFMVGFSYTKATQILVARRIGEDDYPATGRIFDNSMAAVLTLAGIIFLALRFGSAPALAFLIEDEAIRYAGISYLEARSWGIFFSFAGSVFLAFYLSIGVMNVLVIGVTLMAVLNIALNYVLIFGGMGLPALGIEGAAYASNIAEAFAMTIFLVYAFVAKLRPKYFLFRKKKLSWSVVKGINNIASPIVLQTLIGLFGFMFFFYYVEKMGTQETAISSIVKNIYLFFGLFTWGFSTAANSILSNLMGQRNFKEVMRALQNIVIMSVLTNAVLCLPLTAFAEPLVAFVFAPTDPEVLAGTVPAIYVAAGALMVYSVALVVFHSIVSMGSVKISLLINVSTVVLYIGYIIWSFSLEGATVPFVWTCEIFYWGLLAVMSFIYIKTGRWKKVEI